MKRILALVVLLPAFALAQSESAAPSRTKVVGVILSTSQALVWDDDKGEYALRRVGEMLDGGRILALENDHVVIERDGARVAVEIAGAPLKAPSRRVKKMPAMIIGALGQPEAAPAPAATPPAPAAPPAPSAAPPPAAPPAPAPPAAAPPAAAPAPAAAPPPAPVVVAAPPPAPPAPVVAAAPPPAAPPEADDAEVEATVIPRPDLDRELGDLASLSRAAQVAPAQSGGFQLTHVRPGSFVSRVGLRAGDVILRVDGRAINKLEDAAAAHAWLRVADRFTVDVVRAGHPMRLHYIIAPTAPRATR